MRIKMMLPACALIFFLAIGPAFGADDKLTGGNGTLYLGGRPNHIAIIDEATEKLVGEIRTKTGTPAQITLSQDKKRFYCVDMSFENIEIIDIASRKVIDTFTLSEGNKKARIFGFEPDPLDRFIIVMTKTATKLPDRWEISAPTLQQYDLKDHKVMRTIPWPKGEEREFANMHFSPNGKLLYFFGEDILIYDTVDFKQVDKWELSHPIEDGFGRIDFNALDDNNEEPGFFTGLFTVQDAVQNRKIMGIARVNLEKKSVDFYALGPENRVSFSLAPGRKMAYGLHSEIGKYEFWAFDLVNHRLDRKVEFPGRPRMALATSSNGKVLYIWQAGNTIDLYEAATFKYLRTITLDADGTGSLHVMPGQ
ncbi:MAG TPA: WD40 repeat domain-containing protein [Bryobacteraceae bacterium]|nr:WD40 repeat domain-containing protein [Bryobacteraceae bacterium]